MPDLRVSIVQSMLRWEDATGNRVMFTEKLAVLKGTTDLVVLPEMFTTGFSMRSAELAEAMDGPTLSWMREQAAMLDAALYGSAIIADRGGYFNRGLFVRPDGQVTVYDKRHLFRFANEHEHFAPGQERVVVDWRGWRILLQICFDLRFPVFARNRRVVGHNDYDLVLYVANWPEARRHPWSTLLLARAIENQAYVAGVNRTGMDGKGLHYSGDSVIIDPKGEVIAAVDPSRDGIKTARLDMAALNDFRAKFPVAQDADGFDLWN
jgi:predicted amidohydrolase